MFSKISSISVGNPSSWMDKLFLTFDLDWCSDDVLSHTLDIVEKYDIAATFFVTHKTPLLGRMRANPNIELGIHPNFNFLLSGDFRYGKNITEVIAYYMDIAPEAVSVRAHSLCASSSIIKEYVQGGLKYECSMLLSPQYKAMPFYHPYGIVCAPHIFEDDAEFSNGGFQESGFYVNNFGLKIFDFHPIHLFLNTDRTEIYQMAKMSLSDFDALKTFVNSSGYGSKDILMDIIQHKGVLKNA